MIKPHPLKGPSRLKLGVFAPNADGGLAITGVPERWQARWDDNLNAAQIADRGGLDFFLPIARWKGFGGKNRVREWSFETFTWAAGLASVTERIALFMTVHVPLVHPVYAAKSLATVDHISRGRAGLNIVCGWNPKEFGMFGVPLVEKGYDQAGEWLDIMERAYASDEPFDYEGTYYKLKEVVSRPASLQAPRPVTMNAAFGEPGREFAAHNCDYLFTTFTEIADAADMWRISAQERIAPGAMSAPIRSATSSAAIRRRRPKTITNVMPSRLPTRRLSMRIWRARRSFLIRMMRQAMTVTVSALRAGQAAIP